MSMIELQQINERLGPFLLPGSSRPPSCYRVSGREKPDFWVNDPENSIVMESLRFPRVTRVRWDKGAKDVTRYAELQAVVAENQGRLTDIKKGMEAGDIISVTLSNYTAILVNANLQARGNVTILMLQPGVYQLTEELQLTHGAQVVCIKGGGSAGYFIKAASGSRHFTVTAPRGALGLADVTMLGSTNSGGLNVTNRAALAAYQVAFDSIEKGAVLIIDATAYLHNTTFINNRLANDSSEIVNQTWWVSYTIARSSGITVYDGVDWDSFVNISGSFVCKDSISRAEINQQAAQAGCLNVISGQVDFTGPQPAVFQVMMFGNVL
eukprot:gene9827-9985_t